MSEANKRLIKKSGIYFIGNISSKLMSAILIPIYAFYINVTDLGFFDFSQTLIGILSPIVILAIWEAVLKVLLSDDDIQMKSKYISTSFLFSFFIIGVIIIAAILSSVLDVINIEYFTYIVAMISIQSLVKLWQYAARGSGLNKLYVVSGIISTFANFSFIIVLVVILNYGLEGLFISFLVGQLTIIFMLEYKLKIIRCVKLSEFDMSILKNMLLFSSPLVLNLVSSWFMAGFGRMIITLKLGTEFNGLYSFSNKFSLIIAMIGSVITMALIEEAILSIKKKNFNNTFNRTIEELFVLFFMLALCAVPAISIFYYFISDTVYYDSVYFAPWMLLFAIASSMSSNIGSVFQAIEKTKYQFTTTVLGGATTVIISFLLIDRIQVYAVILGQILGASVMLLSRYFIINKFIPFKISWKKPIILLFSFTIITVVCLNASVYISIALEIIVVFIGFVFYRDKIKSLSGKKSKKQ